MAMLAASSARSPRSLSRSDSSSAPVVGIDLDIAVGEIAGPDPRLAAADPDIDLDADIAALDVLGNGRLVVAGDTLALGGDQHAADLDRELVAIRFLAGLADRHDDAAPIRVLA